MIFLTEKHQNKNTQRIQKLEMPEIEYDNGDLKVSIPQRLLL